MDLNGRILAIDPGQRKIGLALSDPTGTISQPFAVWSFDNQFWPRLSDLISTQKINHIVIGTPRPTPDWITDFITRARARFPLPIETYSEIYTTKIALAQRRDLPKAKRRQADDAEAAAVLLRDYLEFLRHRSN